MLFHQLSIFIFPSLSDDAISTISDLSTLQNDALSVAPSSAPQRQQTPTAASASAAGFGSPAGVSSSSSKGVLSPAKSDNDVANMDDLNDVCTSFI